MVGTVNLANSFLQGMAAVDQMETNRQTRAFNAEKQSWLRTLWERKDEEYEKGKLDIYRAKKAVEASLISEQIMKENTNAIDELMKVFQSKDSTDKQRAAAKQRIGDIEEKWFTGIDARANLMNEVWKRQMRTDPMIGEFIGLIKGQDPAAGPLVRDPTRPVSGFGIAPPSSPFAGKMFIEIAGIKGDAPMTVGRGGGDKDEVWMAPANLADMYALYGSPELIQQYKLFDALMEELGEGVPTGRLDSADQRAREGASEQAPQQQQSGDSIVDEGAGGGEQSFLDKQAEEYGITREQLKEARKLIIGPNGIPLPDAIDQLYPSARDDSKARADAAAGIIPATDELIALVGDDSAQQLTNLLVEEYRRRAAGEVGLLGGKDNTRIILNEASKRLADFIEAEEDFGKSGSKTAAERGETAKLHIGAAIDHVLSFGEGAARDIAEVAVGAAKGVAGLAVAVGKPVIDFVDALTGGGFDAKAEAGPESTQDIVTASKEKDGPPAGDFTSSAPEKGQQNTVAAFASPQAAEAIANNLFTGITPGKPAPHEVYKAYMMFRAGMLTLDEVVHFKRTGQMGKSAERKYLNMGEGYIFAYDGQGNTGWIRRPGSGVSSAKDIIAAETQIFNAQDKFLAGSWTDSDGKEIPSLRQFTLNSLNTAMDMLRFPKAGQVGSEARTNRSLLNSMQAGINMVRNFDPDYAQKWDLVFWSEPKINANNAAVGFILDQGNITSVEEQNVALYDYGITYQKSLGASATPETYLSHVIAFEAAVSQLDGEQRRGELPPGYEWAEGKSRQEIRTGLIKRKIEKKFGS